MAYRFMARFCCGNNEALQIPYAAYIGARVRFVSSMHAFHMEMLPLWWQKHKGTMAQNPQG